MAVGTLPSYFVQHLYYKVPNIYYFVCAILCWHWLFSWGLEGPIGTCVCFVNLVSYSISNSYKYTTPTQELRYYVNNNYKVEEDEEDREIAEVSQ